MNKYLKAYQVIFTTNPKARHLKTWYVDAFAGTGSRSSTAPASVNETLPFDEIYKDEDTAKYRDGSAKIALSLPEPFNNYLFIDKSKARVNALRGTIERDFPALLPRCEFRQGEANEELQAWCKERNWQKERAVVFLDPYGMQVEWTTVEALARTKAIDLWYLFPMGVGVSRVLPYDGKIDESWQRRLDLLFGTTEWRTRFYETRRTPTLFEEEAETVHRTAEIKNIMAFIHERLATCFVKVAKGKILRNSRGNPMYLLCFAASNEQGAPTALRIAQNILKD